MSEKAPFDLVSLTARIVENFVGGNHVSVEELPSLIQTVYDGLSRLGGPQEAPAEKLQPAVSVRRSVTPDYIVCLEDGKKLKMLKRHLRSTYNMTPEEYRTKWGLPADYPMVAPNYAEQRSNFAKQIGLGKGGTGRGKKRTGGRRPASPTS